MPLNKYRVMNNISETGNISKSAQDMVYTQQALSRIIKSMEEEYGFSLFLRTRDGVVPTSQCEKILPLVREVIEAEDKLMNAISDINNKKAINTVHIGACGSVVMDYLHRVLLNAEKNYPEINLEITYDAKYLSLVDKLNKNTFDCIITVEGKEGALNFEPLFRQDFFAVLPKGHPLENNKSVSISDLYDYQIVITVDNPNFDELTNNCHNVIVVDEEIMMLPIISRSAAVGITTGIDQFCVDHEHIKKPLDGDCHRVLGVATRNGETNSKNLDKILEVFRETKCFV